MNIIRYRNFFLAISASLVLAGILAIVIFCLNPGIDFLGGTLWQLRIPSIGSDLTPQSQEALKYFFEQTLNVPSPAIYSDTSTRSIIIRLGHISEAEHQSYLTSLRQKFGSVEEQRFDTIGPSVGKDLKTRAILGVIGVLVAISLYVTYAFRKASYPIKSWKYGVITLVTLFHDVAIPLGLFAVLGKIMGAEVDINFVVAALVVMGFSVHDTIVVFDRVRENLLLNRQSLDFEKLANVINRSINQTMARSINTSLTLVMVLLTLLFFGPSSLRYFSLTILVGVTVGAYSSIFVASPMLLITSRAKKKPR